MIQELIHTVVSTFRVILHSRIPTCFRPGYTGKGKCLKILGNGKSLNENVFQPASQIDYMVVNRHILSGTYKEIQPLFYVIADPFFLENPAGLDILKRINEQTTWKMYLCLPYSRRNKKRLKSHISNPYISLQFYNVCKFRGIKRIAYFLYNRQLSMPVVQNVLVACLMLGIYMRYSRIELYGVEHTWTRYLSVGEDNLVYLENPHFFDKEKVEARPLKDIQLIEEYPFYLILENYARMFKSYWEIKKYLKFTKLPIDIINKTKGSYIDAFKRS